MTTRTTQDPPSHAFQWREQLQQKTHHLLMPYAASDPALSQKMPTVKEHRLYTLGFILSILSIFCSFFPICGLPIAVSGLIIGIRGRYVPALRRITSWTIMLSIIGLALTLLNMLIILFIYFGTYLWQ